jgi:CheY-like chemotaxis protein/HPt (histidine-containing phosphotransfer) domain-containing protein
MANLRVASGLLNLYEIEAETASSGQEAIELVETKAYDLVFMDHMMPGMDGVEATKIIRDKGNKVPIIAFSANAVAGMKEMFLSSGMNDFLSKPIVKASLTKMLGSWLPSEKLAKYPTKHNVESLITRDSEKQFWMLLEQIQGLSVQIGLGIVADQKDIYKETLKLTISEIEKSKKNLPEFLQTGDMYNFRVEVHGIKGSLANIGAQDLSTLAYDLEKASARMETSYCTSNLPQLMSGLSVMERKLQEVFSLTEISGETFEIPPELPAIFDKLVMAFDEIELEVIDDAIENLNTLEMSVVLNERVGQIKSAVFAMDYDEAKDLIRQLLKPA